MLCYRRSLVGYRLLPPCALLFPSTRPCIELRSGIFDVLQTDDVVELQHRSGDVTINEHGLSFGDASILDHDPNRRASQVVKKKIRRDVAPMEPVSFLLDCVRPGASEVYDNRSWNVSDSAVGKLCVLLLLVVGELRRGIPVRAIGFHGAPHHPRDVYLRRLRLS